MKANNPLIEVTIYVWGNSLDPATVASYLGVEATFSRKQGEKRTSRSLREITAKTGVWAFTATTEAEDLSIHIQELASKIGVRASKVSSLPGVEGAYVDVFVAVSADDDGGGKYGFRLSLRDLSALQEMNLPIEFTLDVGRD
jgi:hypothetical protein